MRPAQPAISLLLRLGHTLARHDGPEHQRQQHDHKQTAGKLGGDKLPADQHGEDDAEFDDEVGRGELKRHRRDEVGSLAEDRPGERDGGVGAR